MILVPRFTLATTARFAGKGLHSGAPASVRVHPGGSGLVLRTREGRWDLSPENVSGTQRSTAVGPVSTVEHLISALAGLGVTDAELEVEGGEVPGLDGSALEFALGLLAAGLSECGTLEVTPPFARIFEKADAHSIAIGAGDGRWRYEFITGARWPGTQSIEIKLTPEAYLEAIAPARTFAFEEELPMIDAAGLGRGLDSASALVLGPTGYLNEARFDDEPARHKLLDLLGDLALSGVPMAALSGTADRSGHTANVRAAAKLKAATRVERS